MMEMGALVVLRLERGHWWVRRVTAKRMQASAVGDKGKERWGKEAALP